VPRSVRSTSVQSRSTIARLALALGGSLLLCAVLAAFRLPRPLAESGTITVHSTVLGQTTTYIGATEAGGFWIDDLNDLGVNTYRLWTKMAELEWWDDDDAVDELWDDSEYGSPTIAQIKADSGTGFTTTVPWADWWDVRFTEPQSWRYGTQSRQGIITALRNNGITPIVVLRTYDDQGSPEMRPWATWALRPSGPPLTDTFRNEWWEHCFAIAYWLNVRNNYGVTHFEVLNEPDYNCQGWRNDSCPGFAASFFGTKAEYVQLVLDAHDAISYANSFAGLPVYVHAPVVADHGSSYVTYTLDNADAAVQVVDYHTYANDVRPSIVSISGTIGSRNPDGILEPIWVSEWGALWSSYDTITQAMRTANQLLTFSEEQVEGVTIFNMYDWSTGAGQDYGLVDLKDDGSDGALRVPTESYYAYRLMIRGLAGGKERLDHTASGLLGDTRTMVTRDTDYVYVIVLRDGVGMTGTVSVDLTAIGSGSGTVTVWEYSAVNKDVPVQSPAMIDGRFSFTVPADGVSLARVDRSELNAVRLSKLEAEPAGGWSWGVLAALALGAGGVGLVRRLRRRGTDGGPSGGGG
jgi:hypothetical protein